MSTITVASVRKHFFALHASIKAKDVVALDQKTFEDFCKDALTQNQRNKVFVQINDRFSYIVHMIRELQGSDVNWYDYANEKEALEGWFDGVAYSDTTEYTGDFSHSVKHYAYDFPSSWFYTDFEDALFQEVHASGKLAKTLQKRNDSEQRLEQLVEEQTRIWDSLTKAQKKLFRPLSENELMVAHKLVR